MPKDKAGNQLTWKEYGERFKEGLQKIDAKQQTKISLRGNIIMTIGLFIGLFVTFAQIWWLFIILCGATINNLVALLGTWQRLKALSSIEETNEELREELLKGGGENDL